MELRGPSTPPAPPHRQADERHQRLEIEKQEALAVKRQLMAARSERQHNTLKGIRQVVFTSASASATPAP